MKRFLVLFILLGFFSSMVKPIGAIGTTGVLSGQVVDSDTNKPVGKVSVTAKSSSDTFTSTTDSNGFFSMAGVTVGSYDITLERVGYSTTTTTGVQVTGDATTNLTFSISTAPVAVGGTTVYSKRSLNNPRQSMTNYGYSDQEIQHILPPVGPNLSITNLYETLPGVGVSYDVYYGQNAPHIRGGTGSDIGYAFDGVPTYETITNTFGSNLTYIGTNRTDFYVGAYPPQYGNFISGYVNQVAKRGSGDMHANLAYSIGTWLDNGARLPSYDTATGTIPTYNGMGAYNPTDVNFSIEGRDKRFSYYFNHIIQDQGQVLYPFGADLRPQIAENGEIQNSSKIRDTLLNLNYELDDKNNLQLLMLNGIQKIGFAGYQELPCNPANYSAGVCFATNTATGFGESFNAFNIANLPDSNQIQSYDLEKFEWSHHFSSSSVFNFRTWRYNPSVYFNIFSPPAPFWEFRRSASTGALAEYQTQLTDQHLIDGGISYDYSNNFLYSASNNLNAPASNSNTFFASGTGILYSSAFAPGTLNVNRVPDTNTIGAWITDEWRPTPKWDVQAGLRYDRQSYLIVPGTNGNPTSVGIPGYANGTPQDLGYVKPAFISPRLGASYQLSDKLTMKSSWGRFVTFAPARRVEVVTGAGVAQWLPGTLPQRGESIDVSWEYRLDDNTYAKLTPYVKHIINPLQSVTVSGVPTFSNGGQIESKGVEFYLKTHDWHNLSGWLSYTYSRTTGSQLPFEGVLTSGPGSLGALNQVVPVGYDQTHVLSVNLDYKAGSRWEIAPSLYYGSGFPYGIGSSNLNGLALTTGAPSTNPLGETTFDSLRHPGWWLGNLAITYHATDSMDAVLNIFNIFNSQQILNTDNTLVSCGYIENASCGYLSNDGSKQILPQYNPLAGSYAPIGYPNLRQFFLTLKFKLP